MRQPVPAAPPALPSALDFAEALAAEAGEVALGFFRRKLDVERKVDESPVTVADRTVEALVRERLAAAWPDHGILGEEQDGVRLDSSLVWVVDPIDGTRSFVTGWPIWGTLLALTVDGRPGLGVIEMPALGERWTGGRELPTRFLSRRTGAAVCRTSGCRSLAEASLYSTSPFYFAEADRPAVQAVAMRARTPRFGGDCYSYGLLASGHVDVVVEALLQPFDYYALIPVVEGAGGVITDWRGAPLGMHSDGRVVAAASPALHAEVLRLLGEEGAAV